MDSLYSPYDAVPVDTAGRQAWRCHEERSRPLGFANITAHLWPQLIHGGRVLIATLHEANVPRDKWTHAGGWVEIMDVDGSEAGYNVICGRTLAASPGLITRGHRDIAGQ